ncbi:HD domain-containing protein [Helicobacter sp. MIT 05-5294]|uniref:HD domain-containing protein n=1 Tax=Helicobacter sp. MIT 05-5294 TaxID=1548150 RepID=UPI00051FC02B|nr:HD domain-containing protein [Helicobacter sp. MIT 05-5294]TLD87511.1 HD domain-containing protein [Helicobacter sp. MIT 05-5294]
MKNLKKPHLGFELLHKIFVAANIRRWNDQATPVEFLELDKQAHKIVIAYLLAHYEMLENQRTINFERLILQFCYEFFERIILTDIKPPVFHKLVQQHNKALVDFVCEQLGEDLRGFGFLESMREYLYGGVDNLEKEILKASHYYASKWEFDIIYQFNPRLYDVQNIKNALDKQVREYYHLAGMRQIIMYDELREVVNMFGQLRFQKRWSQTPRVPCTSVLGHTLIVALCAYLLGYDLGFSKEMQIQHFLCGLFHDLPEILTRDIISPIKKNVEGLDAFIKKIEEEAVREKILNIIPDSIAEDIQYYTQNEFSNRYKKGDVVVFSQKESEEFVKEITELQKESRKDSVEKPIFGEFLKYCDHLSAFLEAKISIEHGIKSKELIEGAKNLEYLYNNKQLNGVDLGYLFREFKDS